ncbi:unnamed protein product, partial [Prorocentrum cordatum]
AKQRKLDTSSKEARTGFLHCRRALRRRGRATAGPRGHRQPLHDQLARRAEALVSQPAASDQLAWAITAQAQPGLASKNGPLASWFDRALEREAATRRRVDAAQGALYWRSLCAESLDGPGLVAHRLARQQRSEAAAVEEADDPRHMAQ